MNTLLGGAMDLARVPKPLHHLAILARKYGVTDDLDREQIVESVTPEELDQLMRAVYGADDSFDAWLAGPESSGPEFSDEYIAFSALRMAADYAASIKKA
ncbi:MAG: hypothetical protein ACFE0K_01725 [Alcanivorax sp.]|uniref:hypothetical protein n=1 Tax=Alcanivorax sp. TaxID=1872427 RepID=UPI003DA77584